MKPLEKWLSKIDQAVRHFKHVSWQIFGNRENA